MSAAPESVWDYPRPPRVEPSAERVTIDLGGRRILDTTSSYRVLETSHPPTYYLPRAAFVDCELRPTSRRSVCEFKGAASYLDVVAGERTEQAVAWFYADPTPAFAELRDHLAVYPSRMDACAVDGETVVAQEGDFYGGWITSRVTGPFKGAPGTLGW